MKSEEFIKFSDPIKLFTIWLEEAKKREINDYNACCLATSDAAGIPSARMVLMKKFDERGFVFYTNLESRKARDFERNVRVALCFHWKSLKRQVRIEGPLLEVPKIEADEYFQSRSRESQIGAWSSKQSQYLPKGYESLTEQIKYYEKKEIEETQIKEEEINDKDNDKQTKKNNLLKSDLDLLFPIMYMHLNSGV